MRRRFGNRKIAGGSIGGEIPTTGLIHYWRFNGDADDEIGTNHATVVGGAYETIAGDEKALALDADAYMDVQLGVPSLPITIGVFGRGVYGTQNPATPYYIFNKIAFYGGGGAYIRLGDGVGTGLSSKKELTISKPVVLGDITSTRKLFILKIDSYANVDITYKVNNEAGVIASTSGSATGITNAGGTTRFGRWWGLGNKQWSDFGEMFVYNKITTDAEDLQIWNRYSDLTEL